MSDTFSNLMSGNDPSVVIVTTIAGDERAGCLVGFHSQCGIDPPRYAIWLSTANRTHEVGSRADVFAVHWIPKEDDEVAALFGGNTGDSIDKFTRCAWSSGPDGVPLLNDCPDRFVGRRIAWVDVDADHSCVVLEPVAAEQAGPGGDRWMRFADVDQIEAGHEPDE